MYSIDLQKTGKRKLKQILHERMGLSESNLFTNWISKGVSGFEFTDRVGESTITYKVNLEIFPRGIGFYCRNRHYNFIVLVPYSEIESLSVVKKADVLRKFEFSWFRLLTRVGFSYWRAKPYLLENEIISTYPLTVTIQSIQNQTFQIRSTLSNLEKVNTFFSNLPMKSNLYISIETFVD